MSHATTYSYISFWDELLTADKQVQNKAGNGTVVQNIWV